MYIYIGYWILDIAFVSKQKTKMVRDETTDIDYVDGVQKVE